MSDSTPGDNMPTGQTPQDVPPSGSAQDEAKSSSGTSSPTSGGFASPSTPSAQGQGQPQYGQFAAPGSSAPQYGQPGGAPQPQYGQYAPPTVGGQQPQYGQYGAPGPVAPSPQFGPPNGFSAPPTFGKVGIIPLRPLSLGEIYDGAFGAMRKAPGVILGFVGIIVSLFVVLAVVIGFAITPWVSASEIGRLWNELVALDPTFGETYALDSLSIQTLVSFVVPVATIFATAVVVVAVSQLIINRPVSAASAWLQISRRIGSLIGVFILVSVVPGVILLALAFGLTYLAASSKSDGLAVLLTLVILAGVVFYFYLMIRWTFAPIVLVLEERKVIDSIKRSGQLARGNFWRVLGYYLLTAVVLSFAIGMVGGVLQFVIDTAAGGSFTNAWWGFAAFSVLQAALTTIQVAALASVITLLYVDIRMRREGLDIELLAAVNKQ